MDNVWRADALAGVPHGFFGSAHPDGSGTRFDARNPADLSVAAAIIMPDTALALVRQVHGTRTLLVAAPPAAPLPEADALVTATPGVLLGIVTADCAPVLLVDRDAGVVGAAHAGWRGARDGVVEGCVQAMVGAGADETRIVAAIGPCIAQASYEVDGPFRAGFPADAEPFFAAGANGRCHFDLLGYVHDRLRRAGVSAVETAARDTYPAESGYFSHRRSVHQHIADDGRQIGIVGLAAR